MSNLYALTCATINPMLKPKTHAHRRESLSIEKGNESQLTPHQQLSRQLNANEVTRLTSIKGHTVEDLLLTTNTSAAIADYCYMVGEPYIPAYGKCAHVYVY